jgi:hypothetical protein
MAKRVPKKANIAAQKQFDIVNTLSTADEIIAKINIEKSLVLQKALHGSDVDSIYKAQAYLQKQSKSNDIESSKTLMIDPLSMNGMGYQDKPLRFSLQLLRNMGKVPVIKSIIGTRIDQVCNFAQPQVDKYSTGFTIKPKKKNRGSDGEEKVTSKQEKRIEELTEFILNCGVKEVDPHRHDTFENFLKKFVKDCLELDQGCIELTNTRGGDLFSFQAVDAATMRIADTYFKQLDEDYKAAHKDEYVDGYLPYYVQVYMNRIINYYMPWEMAMCVRNPSTDIYSNGYGRSELEDLISTVTNLLNADQYNANFFKVGSAPKGILRVTGNVNTSRLEEFKTQWQSQMAGVRNAHKLPIIEAEKMDFISTGQNNREMEYSRYYEFLLKITCAVFRMSPEEINFNTSGGSEQKPMFESGTEAKLSNSKDRGLLPLLRFIASKINKNILNRLDPDYEFSFEGMNLEDPGIELQENIQKLQNFMSLNEIRRRYKLKDVSKEEGGDQILNPLLVSMKQQAQQMEMQKDQMNQGQEQEQRETEPGGKYPDEEYGNEQQKENPFINKALNDEINKILCD